MANTEIRIYITHFQIIITDNRGFRFEINIPDLGDMAIVDVHQDAFFLGHTFHVGHHPGAVTPSPNLSPVEPEESSSLSTPSENNGDPGNTPPN